MKSITLGDLMSKKQAKELIQFVGDNQAEAENDGDPIPTTKNLIMKWLDNNHDVTEKMHKHEIIKPYGAYLLAYLLKIE